jgi:hypothetical protein
MTRSEDQCDIIDILEESATTGGAVAVELASDDEEGEGFVDRVRDVVTTGGEDFAEFSEHGRLRVSDIRSAARVDDAR